MSRAGFESRHGAVLDAIGRRITDGDLTPGDTLTLEAIQERFGVSRTVARETMRILESMGLVTSRRRVGITVRDVAAWNVFDPRVIWWRLEGSGREEQLRSLTELRIAVEPLAASAAARNASAEQRAGIVELGARMRGLGERGLLEDFLEADIAFHTLLLRASGNEMFAALADVVAVVLRGRTQLGLMPRQPVAEALEAHENVAAAVSAGQYRGGEDAMRQLLDEVREAMAPLGSGHPSLD